MTLPLVLRLVRSAFRLSIVCGVVMVGSAMARADAPQITWEAGNPGVPVHTGGPLARTWTWHCDDPGDDFPLQQRCRVIDTTLGVPGSGPDVTLVDADCGTVNADTSLTVSALQPCDTPFVESAATAATQGYSGLGPGNYRFEVYGRDGVGNQSLVDTWLWEITDGDGDGVPDADDNCPAVPNGAQTDGDGVPDVSDNCPQTANPGQADPDGDGLGDECDDDLDGDDIDNDEDNCIRISNPGQQDEDGDGTGDACEGFGAAQAGGCNCRAARGGRAPLPVAFLCVLCLVLLGLWRRRR